MTILAIAAGGALGSVSRAFVDDRTNRLYAGFNAPGAPHFDFRQTFSYACP